MPYIPPDIWLYIAEFIPDHDLKNMFSVNSLFFGIAMRLRYNSFEIDKWYDPAIGKKLARMRDPFVARLVRRISLKLLETKQYSIEGRRGITAARLRKTQSLRNLAQQFTSSLGISFSKGSRVASPPIPEPDVPRSFSDLMEKLTDVLPNFINVIEFSIDSWDLPPTYDLGSFLSKVWSVFGDKLEKLAFYGNIDSFRYLTASTTNLLSLHSLALEITMNLYNRDRTAAKDQETLLNQVAPIIHLHASQLRSLTVWCWVNLDLSALVASFPDFPFLHHLAIRTPFNSSFREDPSSLRRLLLEGTPSLQHLQLRLNPTGAALDRSFETRLAEFFVDLLDDPLAFTSLKILDFYPTNLQSGISVITNAVTRCSDTLTQVCVRDRHLTFEEMVKFVDILSLCKELKMLRCNVWKLDLQLLDLLYKELPRLRRLTIFVSESVRDAVSSSPSIPPALERDLESRLYVNWELHDIGFWKAGARVEFGLMTALARSIPSVRSFWGTGHMLSIDTP